MKAVKDLAPADLIAERRRCVLYPGNYEEGRGYRAQLVFEDHPYKFFAGEKSNLQRPDMPPPLYFPASEDTPETRDAADATAKEWSKVHFGVSDSDYFTICLSSISAQNKAHCVTVKRDPDSDECWLADGYGNEMRLEGENAIKLYQDLARAYYLPYRESCSECGYCLNDEDKCDCCGNGYDDE